MALFFPFCILVPLLGDGTAGHSCCPFHLPRTFPITMVQISQTSAQMQSNNLLGTGYYLKSWICMGEEHDISFLLFFPLSKATWGHSRPPSPCTEPLSRADCNAEITECCGQEQSGQLSGAHTCQVSEPTALLALLIQKQTGLLLQSRDPAKGKFNQSYNQKEPK